MNELTAGVIAMIKDAIKHCREAGAWAGGPHGTCGMSVNCGMSLNDEEQFTYGIKLCGQEINHAEARLEIIKIIDEALNADKVTHTPRYTEKFGPDCWKLQLTYDAQLQTKLGSTLTALNIS